MNHPSLLRLAALFTLLAAGMAQADPLLTSWFTARSSTYARIVETDAELAAGTSKTTWSRTNGPNTLSQTAPVYAGPQQIDYSASWVYVKTPDLGTYLMGPWYDNAAKTALFVNILKNQNITFRLPRTTVIPTTKTGTAGLMVGGVMQDAIGFCVDGVAIFDPMDGYTYNNGTEAQGGPGQWHRDAYVNEGITFDKSYAHQQNTGKYHNHANPYALRHQLGDNVIYTAATGAYAEGNTATPARHSPIIGWMLDGLPVYGPYGYSTAMDATSGVRRMTGGFVLRNGATAGVDNITTAGRTLPAWTLRNNGNTAAAGPAVSTTYPLGRYIEDWAYLGDLVKTGTARYAQGIDFDLNEYNVRYAVTPEFPAGTWAYFLNVTAAGTPQFPYMINRWFHGTPTGGAVTTVAETVTNIFKGGANLAEASSATLSGNNVQLTWSSVEGGTYKIEATENLSAWSNLSTTWTAAAAPTTSYTENSGAAHTRRFYRITRTATAAYDDNSGTTITPGTQGISTIVPATGTRGTTATVQITLNSAYSTAPPPNTVAPTSVTLTRTGAVTVTGTALSRNSTTGVVSATFAIPAGATPGAYTANATFGPNTWSLANGFFVN